MFMEGKKVLECLKYLFFYIRNFYLYEKIVLSALTIYLKHDAINVVSKQLKTIALDKRIYGKEILVKVKNYNTIPHFINTDERELLRITLLREDTNDTMKVDIIIKNGLIFKFLFYDYPKTFFKGVALSKTRPKIIDAKVLFNPMVPSVKVSTDNIRYSELRGWMKSCYDRGLLINLKPPLELNERKSYIEAIDAKLPSDYIEFLDQADYGELTIGRQLYQETAGVYIKGLKTYDPIIRLPFYNSNYYMIADVSPIGSIVLRYGNYNLELLLLLYDDYDNEIPLNTISFVEAINKTFAILYEGDDISVEEQAFI